MEEEKKGGSLRKKAVKRFAAIFIIVLLLLTFFSNTIMNYSLPEVATVTVQGGTVSQKIRCQGEVETSKDLEVTVSGTRTVKEVLVESGDKVTEGQMLVTFEEEENEELVSAEDTLEQLERAYEKSLLKVGLDYTDDYVQIQNAKDAVSEATADLDQARLDAAALTTAKNEEASAKADYDTKKREVDSLQASADGYSAIGDYSTAEAEVQRIKNEISTAETALSDLNEDLERMIDAAGEDSDEVITIRRSIRDKETEIETLKTSLKSAEALASSLSGAGDVNSRLSAAKAELDNLSDIYESKQSKVAELSAKMTVKDAEAALKERQQNLDSLNRALSQKQEQDRLNQIAEDMDLAAAQEEIEKQREKVEKLKAADDSSGVVAGADGIISDISLKKGDKVSQDMPIATIQLAEGGYEVTTTISKSEGALIKVGNEASIENVWGSDITATVKSIKADPSNPNQNMLVKFEVKGDARVGQTLQFAVGEKSARYDCLVPNNALNEDAKGKFVLVVKVKGTPLGNRYVVKRVDVQVPASDTTKSAVTGDITEYDNIVTNSSKPLDNGQQVRLSENQ